jgi:Domain of unknown function (DUF4337)
MSIDDVREALTEESARNKWIGVWIGVLAVLLAVCGVGGGNAAKDANRANIDASNTWAFFQAKNIRRTSYILAADELELTLLAQPGLPPEAATAIKTKMSAWRATADRYRSEPDTREGLAELSARAKEFERERDQALRKDPYFDLAEALIQIGIVLASVAIIAGTNALLFASFGVGALGLLLMLNGFWLFAAVPGLG